MISRIVFICTFIIICFCSTSCTEKSTESSQLSSEQEIADEAVKAIILIFNGAMMYRQDYSEDPRDVAELITLEYSAIDEQTNNQWDFALIGHGPLTKVIVVVQRDLEFSGIFVR